MKTNNNIPAYRFQGYTDAWELRPLGEIGNTYTGLSGKTKDDFGHGDGRFVTYMNVFSNPISLPEMVEAVEIDESQNTVRYGDVLFTTSSETPEEVGMSSVWLENTENTYLNSFCFGFRPVKKVNPYYLAYLLRSSGMRRKISFLAQGISRYNISKTKMMELEISIPNENEQEVIGTFFSTLDRHITLHQRKLDKLKEQKKTYLKLLFPAKGQTQPALRFQGFEDDWEEVKLGEVILKEIKGKAKSEMLGSAEVYLETEYLNGGTKSFVDCEKDVEEDDILILWDGSQAGMVYHGFSGALGSTLKAYRPKESGKFIYYQLVSQQNLIFEKYRTPNIPHVIKTFTDEFRIFYSSLPEQEVIGTFFQNLDQAIAQVEDKLASLKEMKKTLLRKLFV
ncbi:TPA: restriction endonuclease subunit S [Streptococcus suis]|nr:restriction endonuclease subunit S [Streptococcus suis]